MSWLFCMTVALVVSVAVPAAAQKPGQKPAAPPAAERPADPLGRETPRGAITGFNQAVHRGDFTTAARYMQLTPALRRNLGPLASDLTDLIDRYYTAPIASLSAAPEGVADDGLPPDRERVALKIDEQSFDVTLVRVKDAEAGQIWLISSRTLTEVPALSVRLRNGGSSASFRRRLSNRRSSAFRSHDGSPWLPPSSFHFSRCGCCLRWRSRLPAARSPLRAAACFSSRGTGGSAGC
jgi:hypothetical protein